MLCIDLSSNNSAPDFHALKARGVEGVWIKLTEIYEDKAGKIVYYVNPLAITWAKAARAVGLRVGFYHFARPDLVTAEQHANFFTQNVDKVARRDLRPVLDYENAKTGGGDETWIHTFNQAVNKALHVGPLFYSYLDFIREKIKLSKPVGYGLWLADYTSIPPLAPKPWSKYVAWQYTDKGSVGTYGPVDLTHTYGNVVLAHPVLGLV